MADRTAPCQTNPPPKPGAIPETCPSGEEAPEATPSPENSRKQPTAQEQLDFADPLDVTGGHADDAVSDTRISRFR
jgi:hypothetical protein